MRVQLVPFLFAVISRGMHFVEACHMPKFYCESSVSRRQVIDGTDFFHYIATWTGGQMTDYLMIFDRF